MINGAPARTRIANLRITNPLLYQLSYRGISIFYLIYFTIQHFFSKNLREKNFWVYGFDSIGKKELTEIKWQGNTILLFGSEGFGMRKHTVKYTDFLVKIDINKKIESLNISNSAAIVFHHLNYLKKNVE